MQLVLDANIVISLLINPSTASVDLFFKDDLDLYMPEIIFEEINRNMNDIAARSKFLKEETDRFIKILKNRVTIVPETDFLKFRVEAKAICPDIKDINYFALALRLKCPLWSNDKILKKQDRIKVMNTAEILSILQNEDSA